MKNIFNNKKLIKLLSITAILFAFVCQGNVVYAAENSCGINATYTLKSGVLTIEGSGEMANYNDPADIPWYNQKDEITTVVVSDGINHIGAAAFYDCNNLYSVKMADSVTSVGAYAFAYSENLSTVNLSKKLETIGERAFEKCTSLNSVKIPSGTKTIGTAAFYQCESLIAVTIPQSVTDMGMSVFAHCTGLVTVQINCNTDTLPALTFYCCTSLENVEFASDIAYIGKGAYQGCTSLENVSYKNKPQDVDKLKDISDSENDGVSAVDPSTNTTEEDNDKPKDEPSTQTPGKQVEQNDDTVVVIDDDGDIDIIVDDNDGTKDVVDVLKNVEPDRNKTTTVTIQLKDSTILKAEVIKNVIKKGVDLNVITPNGCEWYFTAEALKDKKAQDLDLAVTVTEKPNPTDMEKAIIGNANCYQLSFASPFYYDAEINLPLAAVYARKYATLYIANNSGVDNLGSVLIDNNAKANYMFGVGSVAEGYLIAINVSDANVVQDAYIPDHMKGEYVGLVDEYGTRYIVTGQTSSLGIGIGEFTRYVVVGLIAVVIIVGVIMTLINRRKVLKERYGKQ